MTKPQVQSKQMCVYIWEHVYAESYICHKGPKSLKEHIIEKKIKVEMYTNKF